MVETYLHLLRATVRAQSQYRLSFAVDAVGTSFGVLLDVVSVLVFFRVTRSLAGFPFREAFLMASLATFGFALADLVAGNVDLLRSLVASDVDLVFCDLPHVPPGAMGRFLLTQMASVAELEAGRP